MPKLKFDISMSLDGFVAGPNQGVDNPLGEGGEALHDWVVKLASWREAHGREGGESGVSDEFVLERRTGVGAEIMGRNMFGGGPGPWGDEPWTGWWGDDPPFHMPVFVLTHHEREPLELSDTTFHFVTDGIVAALERAFDAAGGDDVAMGGGANTIQQYLAAGLVDEFDLHVAPLMLGGGERLFDHVGDSLEVEAVRAVQAPDVTHLSYRVVE